MKLMRDLLEKQLQHLYTSEKIILDFLPDLLSHTTERSLKELINAQIKSTYEQTVRLEKIGSYLHMNLNVRDGKIIKGLLSEIKELFEEFPKGVLMDVGIVSKLQHVQHFQISAYESTLRYTEFLKLEEVSVILEETLEEAYEGDENCSQFVKDILASQNKY